MYENDERGNFMDDQALTAGIALDGLRSRREIKILICFIINSFDEPLCRHDLLTIVQREGLANYFETCAAIEDLIEKGNISEDTETELLAVTDDGKTIAESLYRSLPFSVREKALSVGLQIVSRRKNERQNSVELLPNGNGYLVKCNVLDGERVMMSTALYVPNEEYAKVVREHFMDDPETLYRLVLNQLTSAKPVSEQTDMDESASQTE